MDAEGLQVRSRGLMADRPQVTNVGINTRSASDIDDEYTCEVEVRITDVLGVQGSSLSVVIECSENPELNTSIYGSNPMDSPTNQGVLRSAEMQVSIQGDTESYLLRVSLYEDEEEIQSEEFTAWVYTVLD